MSRIIDFAAARARREAPDPEHMHQDEAGRPLYDFALDYRRADGRPYSINVRARDLADAEAHAAGLSAGCTVAGQIFCTIPR